MVVDLTSFKSCEFRSLFDNDPQVFISYSGRNGTETICGFNSTELEHFNGFLCGVNPKLRKYYVIAVAAARHRVRVAEKATRLHYSINIQALQTLAPPVSIMYYPFDVKYTLPKLEIERNGGKACLSKLNLSSTQTAQRQRLESEPEIGGQGQKYPLRLKQITTVFQCGIVTDLLLSIQTVKQ
ncbi:hypothetical protein Trydic_g3577 [Trypoxylus dichotomus]